MIKKRLKNVTFPGKRKKQDPVVPERITNETVAEHREKILAGGRKFKYPVQYARHRLVINTILISILAIILLSVVVWWQLYPSQNTSSFFYRITQLVPLPVAKVDGRDALYSNYLMEYRSSIHWLQTKSRNFNLASPDGQRQSNHVKRQSLNSAIETAYAQKLAEEKGISVSDQEVDKFIKATLAASDRKLSRESYQAVLSDSYGVSESEYRSIIRLALLKQKVSFAVDRVAQKKIESAQKELKSGVSFETVAQKYSEEPGVKSTKGDVGFVPKNNQDQGVTQYTSGLRKGQVSPVVKLAGAYYLLVLTDSNDTQVRYSRIKVEPKQFDEQLSTLKKQHRVQEYISVQE